MGNLWRRYWNPVGCSALVTSKPQRITVLGEELVLYRGASGKPVLMQLRCAHRNVALDYGRVEGDSIRCPYHGWLYNSTGKCVAQPAEGDDIDIKDDFSLTSYPTEEASGLIFAYMGPGAAPVLPIYDVMRMENGYKQIRTYSIGANWMQSADNLLDVTHFAWLHGYTFPAFSAKRVEANFDRKDYGIDITLGAVGGPKDTAPYIFPAHNRFALPDGEGGMLQVVFFRVPTNDHSHENYMMIFRPAEDVPPGLPVQATRFDSKVGEYLPLEGDWWNIELSDQDRMAIEQQGVIADRTREHLVPSDVGIVRMRRMLREGVDAVERGEDPPGIIRDPAKQYVDLNVTMVNMSESREDTDYSVGLFTENA
jgi:5,5'-dehydrodivanillate O-demethylase